MTAMKLDVIVEGFPCVFHDIVELCDFLVNLSPRYLYMFDQSVVLINGYRFAWICVVFRDRYYIEFVRYPIH